MKFLKSIFTFIFFFVLIINYYDSIILHESIDEINTIEVKEGVIE